MKIEWHRRARTDLAELVEYIANDDPMAAYRVHDAVRAQISLLSEFPEIGRRGRVPGTRELLIARTPYIAAYRTEPSVIIVLRILHAARRWPRRL